MITYSILEMILLDLFFFFFLDFEKAFDSLEKFIFEPYQNSILVQYLSVIFTVNVLVVLGWISKYFDLSREMLAFSSFIRNFS